MRILSTQYTLSTRSIELYVSGCNANPHCAGCHNPESWDFEIGEEINDKFLDNLSKKINAFESLIDNIMIFGGEPLDQDLTELEQLLYNLSKYNKPIWIFTRYELKDIPDFVKKYCEYIKCGRYIKDLSVDNNIQYNIKLATSNQNIYKKGKDFFENNS